MIYLKNDYCAGAHPVVLQALIDTNMDNTIGYGMDPYCDEAREYIKELIGCPEAAVYFAMAGTQTNLSVIGSTLRPHEAVISASTGHICVHEAGAIEATGHKIIHVPTEDGKLRPADIDMVMEQHCNSHWVVPKMVFISNLTETGLVYSRAELKALREACDRYGLYLYMDGARLAMALTQKDNDLTFRDLPEFCDAFYIGGTKCGTLMGECIVLVNKAFHPDFQTLMKQRGAVLAKGRLLGIQFKAILENNLYLELGKYANDLAMKLADGIRAKGYDFEFEPCSNLVFPIFPMELIREFEDKVLFDDLVDKHDGTGFLRLCTAWSTTEQEIEDFLALI